MLGLFFFFFFSSRRRHSGCSRDWSSGVCSSDLVPWGARASARPSCAALDPGAQPPELGLEPLVAAVEMIDARDDGDRKSTRLNSSHGYISYAVFCLKKKKKQKPSSENNHQVR